MKENVDFLCIWQKKTVIIPYFQHHLYQSS
jgi:hypothetical protein